MYRLCLRIVSMDLVFNEPATESWEPALVHSTTLSDCLHNQSHREVHLLPSLLRHHDCLLIINHTTVHNISKCGTGARLCAVLTPVI